MLYEKNSTHSLTRRFVLGKTVRFIAVARFALLSLAMILQTTSMSADEKVPEPPENYILDQGRVFPQEVIDRLSASLRACAHDYDLHIYVVTVPTLKVMPSREREKLEAFGDAVTEAWTKDRVGAVIVFDDEAGWVTVGASDEAEKHFSSVAINMMFKDPLVQTRKKHLSPDKLEAAAMVLVRGMTELRIRENQEAHHRRIVRIIFGSVFLIALILGGVGFLSQKRDADSIPVSPGTGE